MGPLWILAFLALTEVFVLKVKAGPYDWQLSHSVDSLMDYMNPEDYEDSIEHPVISSSSSSTPKPVTDIPLRVETNPDIGISLLNNEPQMGYTIGDSRTTNTIFTRARWDAVNPEVLGSSITGLWESEIKEIQKRSGAAYNVAPNGDTSQSSTQKPATSRYATDGQLSSRCTLTEVDYEPWWTLDLRLKHVIFSVAITNRRDCCAQDLDGAEIHIGNNVKWKNNPSCVSVSSMSLGETVSFSCYGMQGQFVTIAIPQKNISLSLCEVQVFGLPENTSKNETWIISQELKNFPNGAPNVASQGIASQSSNYDPHSVKAEVAIDGTLSSNYQSCSHTKYDPEPWWTVDLQSTMRVFSIAITNRGDCCGYRADGAEIRVGNSKEDGKDNPRCAIISSIDEGRTLSVYCYGMEGRYVSVIIPGRSEYLTLCEVQIFALPSGKPDAEKSPDPKQTQEPENKHIAELENTQKNRNAVPVPKIALTATISQSSIRGNGLPVNARDGNLANKTPDKECAVTEQEFEPWWTVSLGSNYMIYSVAVTNRGDCCASDLDGAEIHVGYDTNWKSTPICGTVSSIGLGKTYLFKCNGMGGKFVTIGIPNKNTSLSLCEVQIFGLQVENPIPYCARDENVKQQKKTHGAPNVAPQGIASQSSIYHRHGKEPQVAIDENINSNYNSHSCTHSDSVMDPSWMVDLKSKMRISSVVITNRADCCKERVYGMEIRIGDSSDHDNPRCGKITSIELGDTIFFDCEGMEGQYVTVIIPDRKEYLSLCELQVFAEPNEGQTTDIGKKTDRVHQKVSSTGTTEKAMKITLSDVSQSSTNGKGLAINAIDGSLSNQNPGAQCAVTKEQYEPWWTGALDDNYNIHSIALTNRGDCCSSGIEGAEIRVGHNASDWKNYNICGTVSSIGLGKTFSFKCNWMQGKFITIVIPDRTASLILCEIQVFAQRAETSSDITSWDGDVELQKQNHGAPNVAPHGLTAQSSYFNNDKYASIAVDGDMSTNFFSKSCTHTQHELAPWWRVDLVSRVRVSSVAITNRGDCCGSRLNGGEIRIGDTEEKGGSTNPRCAKIDTIGDGQTYTFDCGGMEGRFVSVILPGKREALTLCEVQVFAEPIEDQKEEIYRNVALKGIASQSSTFSSSGEGRNAIDGSLANNHIMSQCSITHRDFSPWWMVNLQSSYKVFSVVITNRVLECCKDRIVGAEIRIGNSAANGGILNPRCGVITSMESGESLFFNCNEMVGQYVTVTIPGRAEHLILCEVQVFGKPEIFYGSVLDVDEQILVTPHGAPNVALQGNAYQSSLYNFFGEPSNAIDGSLSSNFDQMQCSQTVFELSPWWTVDLKGVFKIFSVAVTNRRDCCWERINNAEIRIGNSKEWRENPRCAIIISLGPGETGSLNCNGMVGKYVTVIIPDRENKLSLCEVQIFGLPSFSNENQPGIAQGKGLSGQTLMFPEEGIHNYAILYPRESIRLTEFTLCLRVSTELSGRREVILLSYHHDGADELNVWREITGQLSLYLRSSEHAVMFSLPSLSTFGTHICVTWESSSGLTAFWVDGKQSVRKVYRKGHQVSPGGMVILGQDQDTLGGNFNEKQSFVGEISDVHLWNSVLPSSDIKKVYERKATTWGNIINWETIKYSLYGNIKTQ